VFERYTESARRVMFLARYEASLLGETSIEAEHLLLGMMRERNGIAWSILSRVELTPEHVRAEVERHIVHRAKIATSVEMPFSEAAKRALQFTAEEADRLKHSYIGPEHMLLGLLREEQSIAASILRAHHLTPSNVRGAIERFLAGPEPATENETLPAAISRVKRLVEALGQSEATERILHELDRIARQFGS
jgi:ATP-dependent Clp protease ATP-binding subunit ClpC